MADELKSEVPAAEIPDLKKREKERKKAGIGWGGGPGGGGAGFQGAVGGSGQAAARAAASAAARAGGQAAAQAARSALMSQAAAFVATTAGKVAMTVLALGVMGGGAVMMLGGSRTPSTGTTELGGISSSINTKRAGRSGLEYAKGQGAGMLKAEDAGKAAQSGEKTGDTGKAEDAGKTEMADTMERDGIEKTQDGGPTDLMENNMKGAKLSDNVGGGFGSKSVFANSASPRFGSGLARDKIKGFSVPQKNGKGGTMVARNLNSSRNMKIRGMQTSRALGQLRGMQSLNSQIKGKGSTADESNAAMASTQFESTQINGASTPSGPDGSTSPNGDTGGGGGPACKDGYYPNSSGACEKIPNVNGMNFSPWQVTWDMAVQKMKSTFTMMKIIGILWAFYFAMWLTLLPVPECSGGIMKWYFKAMMVITLAYYTKVFNDAAEDVIKAGNDINEMKGEPIGNKLKEIGQLMKKNVYFAITGLGSVVIAFMAEGKLNDLQKDADQKKLQDKMDAEKDE